MKKQLFIIPILLLSVTLFAQDKLSRFNNLYLQNLTVEEIPTNSELSDLGPCLVNGDLYFTSFSTQVETNKKKKETYYDVFSASINSLGIVNSTRNIIDELATEYHEGPSAWDAIHEELVVTRSNSDDPMITPYKPVQKKELNLELIITKLENGKWVIQKEFAHNNKDYSVGHPAFTPNGDTLIFVSDMPGGYGETDLYMSVRLNNGWSEPKNLGNRINSAGKEFTPFVTANGILIFASDGMNANTTDLDLFYTLISDEGDPSIVKFPAPINSSEDDFGMVVNKSNIFGYFASNRPGTGSDDIYRIDFNMALASIKGKVINKFTREPINQAIIEFSPPVVMPEITYTGADGLFDVKAPENQIKEVTGSKEGFTSETIVYNGEDLILIELAPEVMLELSVRDAETKDYLSDVTIHFNGQDPVLSEPDGIITRPLEGNKQYYIRGTHPAYLDNSLTTGAEGKPGNIKATLWMYKGVAGKTFVLENIYYDFDKWDILEQSAIELDKLVNILKENPELKVELGSHTDSRGTDDYNLWLSEKRSASAIKYINDKGFSNGRISAKGYGESSPEIANPQNETEHRLNRRTTFTIKDLGSGQTKIASVPSDQSRYGKTSTGKVISTISGGYSATGGSSVAAGDVTYWVQFYATVGPSNINKYAPAIVEKYSQYGIKDRKSGKYNQCQLGPFTDKADGERVYNEIFNMGYTIMLLEYRGDRRARMLLPNNK